jgi:chemotaxis protein MotB
MAKKTNTRAPSGSTRRHGGHDEEHGEHENEERWLLTYADMITLLMVLFIVMFAISQVDQKKFMELSQGLSSGFGAPVTMLSGSDAMLNNGDSVVSEVMTVPGQNLGRGSESQESTMDPAQVAELARATEEASVAEEVAKLKEAQKELEKALIAAGEKNGASFRFDERGLVVTIATDKVLFTNGSANLTPQGKKILDALGPTLRVLPNRLSIDGHTNRLPINTTQFPSNWELSTARATGVLRYLSSREDIPVTRMSAAGFADTHPLVPKSDPASLTVNRRVEIVVIASVDDAQGRAVEHLGNDTSHGSD